MERKPNWLKMRLNIGKDYKNVREILKKHNLNTVCDEAICPNKNECFSKNTATFLILGKQCTRNCRFCAIEKKEPEPIRAEEPLDIAQAILELGLKYVVITSVTRDDLQDGGAEHFSKTVGKIKELNPKTVVEVLIPDFKGDILALKTVVESGADVIGHNIETVPALYKKIRPEAIYERSLSIIENIKRFNERIIAKTGIMLGLGETKPEVIQVFSDLIKIRCDILTMGQYLAPSTQHHPVVEYISPQIFNAYKQIAEEMGISFCASSPFTRSSYLAHEGFSKIAYLR